MPHPTACPKCESARVRVVLTRPTRNLKPMTTSSKFETALQCITWSLWKEAVIDVLDTAELVSKWAADQDLADPQLIVGLTQLVIARKQELDSPDK